MREHAETQLKLSVAVLRHLKAQLQLVLPLPISLID
jgi:hypothetical protein